MVLNPMRVFCSIFLFSLASGSSIGFTTVSGQGGPLIGRLTQSICLPFTEYQNMTEALCRQKEEIATLMEQQNAAQVEANLKQAMFEQQLQELLDKMLFMQENSERTIQLAEAHLKLAKLELEECQRDLNNTKPTSCIRPEIEVQLQHMKTGSYYISSGKVNWHMARKLCKHYGMDLASVETKAEDDALKGKLVTGEQYWLSGSDLGSEGSFYWTSTGHAINATHQNWSSGQPDNDILMNNQENCVHYWDIYREVKFPFSWNDAECGAHKKFICEAKVDQTDCTFLKS